MEIKLYIFEISWKSELDKKNTCIVTANNEEEGIEEIKNSKWGRNLKGCEEFKVEKTISVGCLPCLGFKE